MFLSWDHPLLKDPLPPPSSWEKSPWSTVLLSKPWFSHLCNGMSTVPGCCKGQWAEVCNWQWRHRLVFVLFESDPERGAWRETSSHALFFPRDPACVSPTSYAFTFWARRRRQAGDKGALD